MSTARLWTGADARRGQHDADMTQTRMLPSEIRRPDLLLQELHRRHPFDRPETLLARVDGPYEQQRLVDWTVLWQEPEPDELDRTRRTEQVLQQLGFARRRRPYPHWPIAVPVVVRPGAAWWSWDEREVWLGLRYGANLCDVLHGDVLTVTTRGWLSHLDGLHGSEPRAAWASVPATHPVAAS